jgi:hypothetical protein
MLKRISDRLSRSISESMDGVGRSLGSETGFQTFAADHIDRPVEHVGDKILHAGIVENRHDDRGVEINQDVDIAVGAVITARDRTEQLAWATPCARKSASRSFNFSMISSRVMSHIVRQRALKNTLSFARHSCAEKAFALSGLAFAHIPASPAL